MIHSYTSNPKRHPCFFEWMSNHPRHPPRVAEDFPPKLANHSIGLLLLEGAHPWLDPEQHLGERGGGTLSAQK